MTNQTTPQAKLLPVLFHGDTLFVVSHNGEPFTPVRTVTDNIGLQWSSQRRKLSQDQERWSVIKLNTETKAGPREALFIPVRKLPAFLGTIERRKAPAHLREKIRLYQNECDNALYLYWKEGKAVNPRAAQSPAAPAQPMLFDEPGAKVEVGTPGGGRAPVVNLTTESKAKSATPLVRIGPDEIVVKRAYFEKIQNDLITAYRSLIERMEKDLAPKPKRVAGKPIAHEEIEEMRRLRNQGFTNSQIAKHLNRSNASVSFLLRGGAA